MKVEIKLPANLLVLNVQQVSFDPVYLYIFAFETFSQVLSSVNLEIYENIIFILSIVMIYIPENTARLIIPLRGFPRVEWAHGNPWPGGKGKT